MDAIASSSAGFINLFLFTNNQVFTPPDLEFLFLPVKTGIYLSEPSSHTEKELLSLIAEGDERAFTQLFRTTVGHLKMHIGKIVKDREALSEVLQETFIKVWLNRDKLPDVDFITAYITKIASHEAFTYLNKRPHVVLGDLSILPVAQDLVNDIEEKMTYKETFALVQQAISELPAQRRLIYQMSRIEGLTSPQIAAQLQLSHGYVRNALSAAQQAIREKLAASGRFLLTVVLFCFNNF